jgi:peptidoglycan/xylan/chitin deacetylase (PgdA/CDA1 family)
MALAVTDMLVLVIASVARIAHVGARTVSPARTGTRSRAANTAGPASIPARPETPVYSFAHSAGRAVYITVDDGWTPSQQVLAIMRNTRLPVTAFLIEQAAEQHLAYWRAFVGAGGMVADHTVSHPNLTKLSLAQATTQWAQARQASGRLLGQTPVLGRPPYGAVDRTVRAAAHRSGLKILVGWSAVADSGGIHTWDGKRLRPGEIVLLHWVRGLGRQLTRLLAVTREDFTANAQTYDVIYDAVGKHSFRRCAGSLKPGGKYLATDGLQNVALAVWTARRADKKVVFPVPPRYAKADVLFLSGLVEAGEYRPVIDRCYPLEQVVEATRYVETQQKTGNVVLTVSDDRR